MADGLLCTEDAAQNVIEKTLVKTCENGDRCGGAGTGVSRGQFPYDNSDRVQLFDKLCVINNNNGGVGGGAHRVGGASGSSKQHDSEDGLLDLVEMMMPCSPAEDDCRKKRCVDRYDSSESSDSGVAVLSCTDCSGSSTASSSDLTDPGSPYSTASNHSEDGGGGNSNGGGNTTSASSPATVTTTDPPPPPPRDTSKPSTAHMPPTTDTLTAHHPPWPWSSSTATETSPSPPPTRCLPPTPPASSTTVTSSVVHLKRSSSSSGKSVEDQPHPVEVASLSDINTATPTITTIPYPKRAKTDTAENLSSTTTTHCLNTVTTATLPNLKQDMGGGGKQFPPPPSRIKSTGNNNNYNGIKSLLSQPSTTTNELLVMKSTNNQITAAKLSSAKMQQGKITEYFKSQYKAKELSNVLLKGNTTVDKFLSSLVEGSGVATNGAILVGGGIARTKKLIRSLGMPPAGKIQIEKLVKNRKTSTVTTPRKILPAPCKPTSSPTAVRARNSTPTTTTTPSNTATGTPTTILPAGDNQLNLANITNHLNVSGLTTFPPTTTVTLATLAFPPAHSVAYIHKAPGKPPDNNSLFMSQFASLIQQHQQQQLHNQQQQQQQLHNQQQQQHLHTQQQHQLHSQQLQQQLHNQHQLHNQQHHPISNFIKFNVPLVKLNTIATTSLPPSGTTAPPHHQQPQQLTATVTPPSVSMLNTAMPTILTAVKSSTPAIASTISNCQIFTGGDKSQMTASPPPPVAVAASSHLPPGNCSPQHPPLADTVAGSTCARIPDSDSTSSSPAVPPLTANTSIITHLTTGNTVVVVDDSSDSGVSSTSSSARERSAQKHHQKTLTKSKPVELAANSQQRCFLGGDSTVQLSPLVVDVVSTIATGLATSPVPSLVLKSPILSQPKTIRFPAPVTVTVINGVTATRQLQRNGRRFRGDGVTTRDVIAGINGIATASLLDTSGDCSVCLWDKCQAQFDASGALLEHLQIKHVISQATQEEYVCLWQGCKVHGRKSCSRSWLERHVLAHAGTKPFRCIVDGCGMRFNSQLTLQRHVNGHFNGDNNTPNGTSKKSVDNNSSLKLYKRNGKKIRFRRQPWSARMFDFIDSSIMEGLQHRLLTMTEKRTMGQFDSSVGDTITLQSEILAKRVEADGVKKVLVRYHPGNVICDEWIREADFTATKQASIPVLNSTAKDTLKPHLFPSENGTLNKRQKHRRKPLVIKTT